MSVTFLQKNSISGPAWSDLSEQHGSQHSPIKVSVQTLSILALPNSTCLVLSDGQSRRFGYDN